LGGFGFPVFEQDGNFSKTHFVIQKIFGMQPFALTKPVFAHVKLFTHAICRLYCGMGKKVLAGRQSDW